MGHGLIHGGTCILGGGLTYIRNGLGEYCGLIHGGGVYTRVYGQQVFLDKFPLFFMGGGMGVTT